MAATESDIIRDEQERGNLLRAIAGVETAIAVSTSGTRRVLENTLENAKKRVAVLDKKIDEAKVEQRSEDQARVSAAAALAAKETALHAREREEYAGFLKEEFFTKKDFGKLEQFYAHSYDRLSEGGKDQLSQRFWEGVKRGEYEFGDAPSIMQRKEAERAKARLGLNELDADQLRGMTKDEQHEFATAYNSDDRVEARRILTQNAVGKGSDAAKPSELGKPLPVEKQSSAIANIDLSSVDLKDVQLADATPATSTSIPATAGSRERGR